MAVFKLISKSGCAIVGRVRVTINSYKVCGFGYDIHQHAELVPSAEVVRQLTPLCDDRSSGDIRAQKKRYSWIPITLNCKVRWSMVWAFFRVMITHGLYLFTPEEFVTQETVRVASGQRWQVVEAYSRTSSRMFTNHVLPDFHHYIFILPSALERQC